MILRNSAKCHNCNDEIVSEYIGEYKQCKCGNVSIYGGRLELHHSYKDEKLYENTSITTERKLSTSNKQD